MKTENSERHQDSKGKPQTTNYVTLDGRGQSTEFQQEVFAALEKLQPGEGLHIIKEFEPLPLYEVMKNKGYEKVVERKGEEEYHVWFYPASAEPAMKENIELDPDKIDKIMDIKLKVFRKELTPKEARELVNKTFESVTAEEFAYGEQKMLQYGITDDAMVEDMDDIIEIFQDVLERTGLNLPAGHPIRTYAEEADELEKVVDTIENKLNDKFIKNEWLELYEKLNQINIHFSRKQNQLFPALEHKGFDRPSKIMWTFDDNVRDAIKDAYGDLRNDRDKAFLEKQSNVIYLVRDILQKERDVLYPTSLQLLSDEEFAKIRQSDDEIGYCLIDTPPAFNADKQKEAETRGDDSASSESELIKDLTAVLEKHGISSGQGATDVMDVAMGKMTLEQINLVYKHLPIDLSYVDENDTVKFYSDTQHRVFPRSAGVIGRKVQNCHPRESVDTVQAIIDAFRKGEQDKAEFWLQMDGKFIYIIYNAVRDEQGNYRGVLEMMQDATHIRSLTGSRKLLTWDDEQKGKNESP
ncbi:MAG: PAS domain-containing protein [Bacteroidales bacterium]|nr:PAS domain-containing protein [Bacteroidales bacterium]MCF8337425.1 PAS domain-containing protein [Bacteroidales bacterium]